MKKMKRTIVIMFAFVGLGPMMAVAQNPVDESRDVSVTRALPNPEKAAQKKTDEMNRLVNLTEKQYKKIYKLFFKSEKERLEMTMPRPEGAPFRGGMPPVPARGDLPLERKERPEGMPSGPGKERQEEMRQQQEKMEKKIRKILTEEQYGKWKASQKNFSPVPEENVPFPLEKQ